MRFKIDWASLMVGSKFTVFGCFTLYLSVIFQVQAPGSLYLEGRFIKGFLCYRIRGLIFGEAYTWRGLFSELYLYGNLLPISGAVLSVPSLIST